VELGSIPDAARTDSRRAAPGVPEDGFIVTDVGWNKNGVGQQFPITVPGTFITPSGLATMGFGPSAVLGVKMAYPDRAAVSLIGDGGFSTNPSVIATAMEAELPVVWLVMDNAASGRSRASNRCTTARASAACSSGAASRTPSTTRRWRGPVAHAA
jgi:thiamine pyrophosphate-dependent acetolactate synthase large subunit-like protein